MDVQTDNVSQAPASRRGRKPILMEQTHPESYLTAEVFPSAVVSNLAQLRSRLARGTALCAVVKANCYGHGLDLLVEAISTGADYLAVATAEEALRLRRLGYEGPLLMFFTPGAHRFTNHDAPEGLVELVLAAVTLTIVSEGEAAMVDASARQVGVTADVHVKVDTGMGRSGVSAELAPALVRSVRQQRNLRLSGLYTHLACADEDDKTATYAQLDHFRQVVERVGGREELLLHAANSAATIDVAESHLDMVRPGIAVYGYQPSDEMHQRAALTPALRLTGRLMQIKDVPAGSRCGYGLTYEFDRPSRLGLVPVGYADGYIRRLSNRAVMRVGGADAPVRGRVSMDQTIIDLTDVDGVSVGDEVEIISRDPAAPNSLSNLARVAGAIPYEIACHLGHRIRRTLA